MVDIIEWKELDDVAGLGISGLQGADNEFASRIDATGRHEDHKPPGPAHRDAGGIS
jgi:hypothetical protein